MKKLTLLCSLVALAGCTTGSEEVGGVTNNLGATVFTSVFTGGGANASGGDRNSGYFVDVWEDSSRSESHVFLSYQTHSVDPTSEVCEPIPPPPPPPPCRPGDPACGCPPEDPGCEPPPPPPPCDPADPRCAPTEWCRFTRFTHSYGWGEIDPSEFAVRPTSAALNTAADGPGFFAETCTTDTVAGTWECSPGTSAPIVISWRKNGSFSNFHSGVDRSTYGHYSFRSNGVWRSSGADAQGSLGPVPVNGVGGINTGINVSKSMFVETPSSTR